MVAISPREIASLLSHPIWANKVVLGPSLTRPGATALSEVQSVRVIALTSPASLAHQLYIHHSLANGYLIHSGSNNLTKFSSKSFHFGKP